MKAVQTVVVGCFDFLIGFVHGVVQLDCTGRACFADQLWRRCVGTFFHCWVRRFRRDPQWFFDLAGFLVQVFTPPSSTCSFWFHPSNGGGVKLWFLSCHPMDLPLVGSTVFHLVRWLSFFPSYRRFLSLDGMGCWFGYHRREERDRNPRRSPWIPQHPWTQGNETSFPSPSCCPWRSRKRWDVPHV